VTSNPLEPAPALTPATSLPWAGAALPASADPRRLISTVWSRSKSPDHWVPLRRSTPCPWVPPVGCVRPWRWARLVSPPSPPPRVADFPGLPISARPRARSRLDLISGVDLWSDGWEHPIPLRVVFVKETLSFLENNLPFLVLARRPLVSCRDGPRLYFYHRNRSNFVFWIPKLVNFISFAYELQIGWFKLQNVHKIILYCWN
jgi:hypothetical protein